MSPPKTRFFSSSDFVLWPQHTAGSRFFVLFVLVLASNYFLDDDRTAVSAGAAASVIDDLRRALHPRNGALKLAAAWS